MPLTKRKQGNKKAPHGKATKVFFDLGFSLALLALADAFTYSATPDQDDRITVQEPQIELVVNLESGNESVDLYK